MSPSKKKRVLGKKIVLLINYIRTIHPKDGGKKFKENKITPKP
jgi:hypothetical protein